MSRYPLRLILNIAPHYYDNLADKIKPGNHYRFVITHFYNARIMRDHSIHQGDFWIVDNQIAPPQPRADRKVNANQNYIVPGFIDLQLNGGFGVDFTSNPGEIAKAASKLGRFGITSFLVTVVSSTPDSYRAILPSIRTAAECPLGAELLGIHLEGPCFNPAQVKAHRKEAVRNCADFSSPAACYGSLENVKLVTLAPELPGALEWIKALSEQGIVVRPGIQWLAQSK
jgi:N-acetylglucosamine-6-phosphate deacetylase